MERFIYSRELPYYMSIANILENMRIPQFFKGVRRKGQIKESIGSRFKEEDVFLQYLLSNVIDDSSVGGFLSEYAQRDARALEVSDSFDNMDNFRAYLGDIIIKTEKHDMHLPESYIDALVNYGQASMDAAAEYSVDTRIIFYNGKRCHGALALTVNLEEAGKEWKLNDFNDFWSNFVTKVNKENRCIPEAGALLTTYGHPNLRLARF